MARDEGAGALAEALALHEGDAWALRSLHLANNEIGDTGTEALQLALDRNECLTALDLSENCIGQQRKQALIDATKRNGFVEELPQLPENRYNHVCAALPTTGVRLTQPTY